MRQSSNGRPEKWVRSPLAYLQKAWQEEGGIPADWRRHLLAQLEEWRQLVKGAGIGDQASAAMCATLYRLALESRDGAIVARLTANFQRLSRSCGFLRVGKPAGRPLEPWRGRIPTCGQATEGEDGQSATETEATDGREAETEA